VYRILDRESLPDYLRGIPEVAAILGNDEPDIVEIGDGNLNFVFKVARRDEPSKAVIVKQAVPYLRMVGEEWPLGRDRMTYEIRALTLYNELVSDYVPTIYHADEEMSTLILEYLGDHRILRTGMMEGIEYPRVADHIGEFLALTLFKTSAWSMPSIERRQLMDRFTLNAELCKLTEEFIFTFPYMQHESNYSNPATDAWARDNIHTDSAFKLDVLAFKDLFVSKTDALLHADLHTGSLMVNADESFIIDMEFAYFGPFGFDVGKIIANFLLCATSHLHRSDDDTYRQWCVDQIVTIWTSFSRRFDALWITATNSAMLLDGLLTDEEFAALRSGFMKNLLQESAGFAACSIVRRTLGIAGVADVRDIGDPEVRSRLEIANLRLAKALMAARHELHSIDDLSALIDTHFDAPFADSA